MTDRELMQQALEALDSACHGYVTGGLPKVQQAITALRAAIEQAQEPVAIRLSNGVIDVLGGAVVPIGALLYTAPRQWQGLTELEQAMTDAIIGGTGVMLGDKRIDPASIYKQPEQEPVAWMGVYDRTDLYYRKPPQADVIPLYTAPPQRQWQGLTDEEIAEIAATPAAIPGAYVHSFARAIEARLKEKNA